MTTETLEASLLSVGALFDDVDAKYTIPIYQRNYAWAAEHIEQLISDVHDAMRDGDDNYFLGNLIVTERDSKAIDYEVIDGQQRLTTLYLLLTYLQNSGQAVPGSHRDRLRYQSRPRSTDALRRIASNRPRHSGPGTDAAHDEDQAIHEGFNIISQFMDQQKLQGDERGQFADYLQNRVTVVRAVLPKKTDLNRYFEIMNTRGQQLQQVDIVKARLMALLDNGAEHACFAWLWEACADMDSYVQMSLNLDVVLKIADGTLFAIESKFADESVHAFGAGRALNYFFAPDHTLIQFLPAPLESVRTFGTLLRQGYGGVGRGN